MRKTLLLLTIIVFGIKSFAQQKAVEKESSFSGVDNIIVYADFCALKVSNSTTSEASFKGIIKTEENLDKYSFETVQEQSNLTIKVIKPEQWKSHWGEIMLNLPKGVTLEVNSQSGKTELSNLKQVSVNIISKSGHVVFNSVQGSVFTNSPTGDLKVDGFKGDLKSKTKTGTVTINKLDGNCNISSHKGLININEVNGKLSVEGGAGNQEIENVNGDIFLKTTSGDLKLSIANGNITVKSFDGDIKLFNTSGLFNVQSSTGNITGTRVGFTESSNITSTEGNIKVQMSGKKDLAFVLKSSNSYLRAMGKSKKKSLKIGKGSIVITGISTTGSQAYY